jgi:hypothetical protein
MCLIDGARMLSPGILGQSLQAFRLSEHPFVYTLGMHLGDQLQNLAMEAGYNQEVEDRLLETVPWEEDGYRLFEISVRAGSSGGGIFSVLAESNCFAMKREDFLGLGGFNEAFTSPGAGLANLDLFNRANEEETMMPILLTGEATFHQFHGGVATNVPKSEHPFETMKAEYETIYGKPYVKTERRPYYFGTLNPKYLAKLVVWEV